MMDSDKDAILEIARENAELLGIDPDLVISIITVESNFDTYAHRFEPQWHYFRPDDELEAHAKACNISIQTERIDEATSFGLMQIMGSVARELGFLSKLSHLYEPSCGLHYGCIKLNQELKKYPLQADAISAYNQGSPRRAAGMYVNQDYVNKVMKAYNQLKGN